ncbi:hypothetical protein BDY19DRAFT_985746 [Irpex rosettiformis]|uniref:Uncharacterized protein n=1 Tax=Irpex rosettiformis TaxID=378272 RepID=A0ACB8U188_9APHY|nr:hypothetical protein BDY19DRAFT_985746 [Irpex rosettiformis]
MRKTSYVVTFFVVAVSLLLNVFSIQRSDWLIVRYPEVLGSRLTVEYGLMRSCEYQAVRLPVGGGSKIEYSDYRCRSFPARVKDGCEKENQTFCVEWTTAGYLSELATGFGAVSTLAIVFGVTTHSRRRRIWKMVAALVALHAICLIGTFAIITDTYNQANFPGFERARPGVAYILGTLAWVTAVLLTFGVTVTGTAASMGHRWAAGNRAYTPIQG